MSGALDFVLAAVVVSIAAALRPWRLIPGGPPWPWVLFAAMLPWWWSLDLPTGVGLLPPLSGAALLVLMAGWPLAVLAMVPIALLAALGGELEAAQALHRAVWLGIVPATIALGVGAAARRWLPRHLCAYVVARGFVAGGITVFVAGAFGAPPAGDGWTALALLALGEAGVTGAVATALVVWQPRLLATYSDRLYLPRPAPRRPRGR